MSGVKLLPYNRRPMRFATQSLNNLYLADEENLIRALTDAADPGKKARERIQETAAQLVTQCILSKNVLHAI